MSADGGPAFPPVHNPDTHDSGMSLRDYFAAKAMQSFVQGASGMGDWPLSRVREEFDKVAVFSYVMADAMVEASKP